MREAKGKLGLTEEFTAISIADGESRAGNQSINQSNHQRINFVRACFI
jgi:hypothetical protein